MKVLKNMSIQKNRKVFSFFFLFVGIQLTSCINRKGNSCILEICISNYSILETHHSQPRLEIKINKSCLGKESKVYLVSNKEKSEMNLVSNSDHLYADFKYEGPFYFKSLNELKSEIIKYKLVLCRSNESKSYDLKRFKNSFFYQLNDVKVEKSNYEKMNEKLDCNKYVDEILK